MRRLFLFILVATTLMASIGSMTLAAPTTSKGKAPAKKKPSATRSKSKSKSQPQQTSKLPTKLPPKKQRTTIDFENNSGTHTTTVIVRTPLPLEEALDDKSQAEQILKETAKESTPKVSPPPKTVQRTAVQPTPPPTPTPAPALIPVPPVIPMPTPPPSLPIAKPEPTPEPELPPIPPPPSIQTEVIVPAPVLKEDRTFHFLARASYMNTKYSRISPELEDGQSTLALGIEREFDRFQGRGLIELGHGMDQAVTIQNTRSVIVRADLLYLFDSPIARPFVGGGIGLIDANVRSYRAVGKGEPVLREHKHISSILAVPFAGVRFQHELFHLDLGAEYTAVLTEDSSAFGGWTASLTLGFGL